MRRYARTFDELLHERLLGALVRLEQQAQDVIPHLPVVHRLLELHVALRDQDVNRLRVGHVAVVLEALADGVAGGRDGDAELVRRDDVRGLNVSVSLVQTRGKLVNARSGTIPGTA